MEDSNVVIQQLNQLLTAYGYNLYHDAARARADDLLVRQRITGQLGESANRLAAMATQYQRDCLPPSTRENPFPPAEAMRPMRQMQALKNRLSDLSSLIRGLPVPTSDRTWVKFRGEKELLHQLLTFDLTLITTSHSVSESVGRVAAADWKEEDHQHIETLLGQLEDQVRQRQDLLQAH